MSPPPSRGHLRHLVRCPVTALGGLLRAQAHPRLWLHSRLTSTMLLQRAFELVGVDRNCIFITPPQIRGAIVETSRFGRISDPSRSRGIRPIFFGNRRVLVLNGHAREGMEGAWRARSPDRWGRARHQQVAPALARRQNCSLRTLPSIIARHRIASDCMVT